MVSLRSPRTPQPSIVPAPSLRKRHSTYVLPTPPDRAKTSVPVPGTSSIRPLRNPAHVATPTSAPLSKTKMSSKDLPFLATGAREEVTPWEFQPGPVNDDLPQASSVASDSSSPVSTRPQQPLVTGPMSEVAPWEMYPVCRSATSRSSLTSEFVEKVTPWELLPIPTVMPNRSTLATGPVEDVTPWELGPAPPSSESSATISENRFSTRGSTSSNQGKSPSEVTQPRRRKSTSAKAKPRFTFLGSSFYPGHSNGTRHPFPEGVKSPTKSAPTHTTSSRSTLPSLATLRTTNELDAPTTTPERNLSLSTADRTIMQELKLEARYAHFVIKGEGSLLGCSLTRHGKKHHAFPPESVPYPRSYGREVIDLDIWETASCQDICESLTWHVFETPPTKVLDLGCGTGTWILDCARMWKNCHFVGLDIVSLQPDLHRVGSLDLSSRITWVHTNFLESLPFPDGEFDFVHVKRIALGVPEDKWDGLFQEINRIMKPGGAFEMLEEDLFFPGKPMYSNDDPEPSVDLERSSRSYPHHHESSDTNFESPADSGPPSFRSDGHSPPTSTTATFPATPSRSNSPVADVVINEDMEKEAREILSHAIGNDYILPPEEFFSHDQALNLTLPPATFRRHLQVKTSQSVFASSVLSLNSSSAGSAAALDGETSSKSKAQTRSRAHSLSTFLSVSSVNSQRPSPVPETGSTLPPVPLLLRTVPKPPPNPRDHSLLEVIYTRLLESRSINMSPLTFLANYVGFYFKDVRTYPPLHCHFPFHSRKNHAPNHNRKGNREDSESGRLSSDDTDDARDAILPNPVSRATRRKHSRRVPAQNRKEEDISMSEENRHVGTRGFIHHSTTLDEPSASVLSSNKSTVPDTSSVRLRRGSSLPKATMHMDLKTLNLHLALRTAEIVACSEVMWEWVQKFSVEVKTRRDREAASRIVSRPNRSGSGSIELPARRSTISGATSRSSDPFESSILDLTREEFDGLISRFEMDMRDNCDIKNALGERFSWHVSEHTVSQEREAFEKGCDKWDNWEQEQLAATPSHVRSSRHPPSGAYVTISHSSAAEGNHIQGRPVSTEQNTKQISDNSVSSLPTRRLSRSMCVFVAWKSYDILSEDP
ncbi:Sterol 24-C-methyltransferase [Termitomyces sp. T112]|nr:Sterol 24-C-methyltransferase [Termitomyces sp. T112]